MPGIYESRLPGWDKGLEKLRNFSKMGGLISARIGIWTQICLTPLGVWVSACLCLCNGPLSHVAPLWEGVACLRSSKTAEDQLMVVSQQSLGDLSVTLEREETSVAGAV